MPFSAKSRVEAAAVRVNWVPAASGLVEEAPNSDQLPLSSLNSISSGLPLPQ